MKLIVQNATQNNKKYTKFIFEVSATDVHNNEGERASVNVILEVSDHVIFNPSWNLMSFDVDIK